MEASKTTIANNQLALNLGRMDSADKTVLISTTNKYILEKRSCGDIQTAFNELLNVIRTMEAKYGFQAFAENANVMAVVDEFATVVERGMSKVVGQTTYTCQFGSIAEANMWLAAQNNITIKTLSVATSGAGLQINNIKLEYTTSEQNSNVKYQFTELSKTRLYARSKPEKVRQQWQAKNPQYTFVTSVRKEWKFGLIGGRVGYFRMINEKYVILYAFRCQ